MSAQAIAAPPARNDRARRRALRNEQRLYVAAHPLAYSFLAGLAHIGPAVRMPGVGVVVSDPALARQVLADTERFRKDSPGSSGSLWTQVLGPSLLLNMEGEAHRELRRKLAPLFTRTYVEQLCAGVLGEQLDSLRARLRGGERVDLVDTMRVIAGTVISRIVGIPRTDDDDARSRDMFSRSEQIVSLVGLRTRELNERQIAVAHSVMDDITQSAIDAYRRGDDATLPGRMRALDISESEACGAVGAFFIAGTETTSTFVPRLVALLCDSGELDRVAADRSLIEAAIEECLRVTTPSPVMVRGVASATTVGGVRVAQGDRVVIATRNCNRSLGGFDFERTHPPELSRLWFGAGQHFCIGHQLALAESRAVMGAVLDAVPLRVRRRRVARGVLIPSYRSLELQRG